jgi:nitroimidazol reductase NimA-like FMN-containing flavoprotein (pyridoxamine 5'-phosphate oxidase superfamily)
VRDTPDVIELTAEDCERILTEGRIAHIASTSQGEPYVTPMSFVMIDDDLFFRTGPGRRVDALRASPRACIEVTILREGDAWESVIFWGEARFIDDPAERATIVAALLHKYHTDTVLGASTPSIVPTDLPIVGITPEDVAGRASGGGLTSKTRPGRL